MSGYTNADIVPLALGGKTATTQNGRGAFSTNFYRVGFTRYGAPYVGYLPKVWARHLNARFADGKIRQVIYSYATPIAWLDEEHGWIVPRVTYSATTSTRHQSQLWRLRSERHIELPWDATDEDLDRVIKGEIVFYRAGKYGSGDWAGTRPGPNYKAA